MIKLFETPEIEREMEPKTKYVGLVRTACFCAVCLSATYGAEYVSRNNSARLTNFQAAPQPTPKVSETILMNTPDGAKKQLPAAPKVSDSDARRVVVMMTGTNYTARASVRLAPANFFLVEFPPGDEIETVVSQDKLMVKMDDAFEREQNSTLPILLRAGAGWNKTPAASSVLVMMKSGAMLQIEISPTLDADSSVECVSWRYNPETAGRARRLAFEVPATNIVLQSEVEALQNSRSESPNPTAPSAVSDPVLSAKNALDRAMNTTANFALESKSNPDINLYTLPSEWAEGGRWTISVVGVKNKASQQLQLVDVPRLAIENKNKKGESVNLENLDVLGRASSSPASPVILQPGEIVYFSLVYPTPVLGTDQGLKLLVTHTNAANNPAVVNIRPGGASSLSVKQKKGK